MLASTSMYKRPCHTPPLTLPTSRTAATACTADAQLGTADAQLGTADAQLGTADLT